MIFDRILFPRSIYCICCGSVIDATRTYSLCDKCADRIRWVNSSTCAVCGKPLDDQWKHDVCVDCRAFDHEFDTGYTCAQYGTYEKRIIAEYKYCGKRYIGREIAEIMRDRMECEDVSFDVITWVPVHKARLKSRGFDQAELIARFYGKLTGAPVKRLLVRIKKTGAMKELDAAERRENIRGAFSAGPGAAAHAADKHILLIDDIYTTGSTADECAAVLKKAGAASVSILTFASGGNLVRAEENQ